MAAPRNGVLWAALGLAWLGCGTVDPGPNFQVADVVFDQNFYYCKVEPMLLAQRCGSGDPSKDTQQSCHGTVTSFRFQDTDLQGNPLQPTDCGGGNVPVDVSPQSRDNWGAASLKMRTDPDEAPLLRRPTAQEPHPREIFPSKSPQADLIRQWATKNSSR